MRAQAKRGCPTFAKATVDGGRGGDRDKYPHKMKSAKPSIAALCPDRDKHPHKTKARKRVSRHFAARGINSPVG